jgi:hypothetical protein
MPQTDKQFSRRGAETRRKSENPAVAFLYDQTLRLCVSARIIKFLKLASFVKIFVRKDV